MSVTRKGDYPQNYKPSACLKTALDSHSPLEEQTKYLKNFLFFRNIEPKKILSPMLGALITILGVVHNAWFVPRNF